MCRRLAAESRTGCLHLLPDEASGEPEVRIWFREGRIHTAVATEGRRRLGEILVAEAGLPQGSLDRALDHQRREPGDVRIGDVLVDMGLVDRETLRDAVRDQILETLALAIGRRRGAWRFVPDAAVKWDVPLGSGMQDALMEASRRLDAPDVIAWRLGGMDAVVDFGSDDADVRMSLRAREWAMLTHIDGRNSIAEIARRAGEDPDTTARVVHGLHAAGVVHVLRPPAPSFDDLRADLVGVSDRPVPAAGTTTAGVDLEARGAPVAVVPVPPPPPIPPPPRPPPDAERTPPATSSAALFADLADEPAD